MVWKNSKFGLIIMKRLSWDMKPFLKINAGLAKTRLFRFSGWDSASELCWVVWIYHFHWQYCRVHSNFFQGQTGDLGQIMLIKPDLRVIFLFWQKWIPVSTFSSVCQNGEILSSFEHTHFKDVELWKKNLSVNYNEWLYSTKRKKK